ncbi:MAG: hypothetical protein WCJ30_03790, partial [Deltaproteobacteria bacterium]
MTLFAAFTAAITTLMSGCTGGAIGEPGTSCQSTRTYFLNEVWGPVMGRTCVSCHSPGGPARLAGARFELLPANYPNFVEQNLQNIAEMAHYSFNGTPLLLAKPLGITTPVHGGGVLFHEGSAEYNAISELVRRLNAGGSNDSCPDYGSTATPSGVSALDLPGTLRRAALDLAGRLPTPAETQQASTDAGFDAAIRAMMEEEAFYRRMRVAWNDVLLTDRFMSTSGCDQRALNMIPTVDFPNRGSYGGGSTMGLDCCG